MSKTGLLSLIWDGENLLMLDQRLLPGKIKYSKKTTVEEIWDSIKTLEVRGAPAIGVAAAYGFYFAAREAPDTDFESFWKYVKEKSDYLASSRPTAVNLFWALSRMEKKVLDSRHLPVSEIRRLVREEAEAIHREDEEICRKIGEYGLTLLRDGAGVLTHCNAGQLATARYGTATAPIYLAHEKGWKIRVFADETRPVNQGSRLTALELKEAGIDVTLICDNMAAMVMSKGWVDAVIVGCDRVAANGDTANKIGTLGLSILAKYYGIPFYVAAPTPTIDLDTKSGEHIPIEERDPDEVTCSFGKRTAPEGIKVYNPAFDVTPAENITAFITEKGIIYPPYEENIKNLFNQKK
ncbi:S-methyl-5-thioribose-1-phosphate isomerase [Thermosediminibacter oceani]|uniref:Methylthioribose-1-phosphate isomerase n=1 Tax=Thermosediminibacter oceani (strain ATCC BAA-1034 / DSM 16646 / JW/IW-1228P) TaxID=555079 RepID=D9RYV6_THEOJ|nr:S-methyl-5-thioribose-1-phosphate isomerase [Thermosediminibacter oceani]ADL08530.1 methylthioribose-1-phosphate isomerase [Thermosediminibacter oceani DSM 16646]